MFRSHHRNCDLSNSWNFLVLLSSFNGNIFQETYIQWCLTVCVESLKLQMRKATAFAGTNFKHGNYLIFWQSQNTEREMVKKKQILCPNSLKWNMDFCKKKKKKNSILIWKIQRSWGISPWKKKRNVLNDTLKIYELRRNILNELNIFGIRRN